MKQQTFNNLVGNLLNENSELSRQDRINALKDMGTGKMTESKMKIERIKAALDKLYLAINELDDLVDGEIVEWAHKVTDENDEEYDEDSEEYEIALSLISLGDNINDWSRKFMF